MASGGIVLLAAMVVYGSWIQTWLQTEMIGRTRSTSHLGNIWFMERPIRGLIEIDSRMINFLTEDVIEGGVVYAYSGW